LFAPDQQSGLFRVSADGHQPVRVTDPQSSENHRFPSFLSDGTHFVFTAVTNDGVVSFRLGSLDSTGVTELFRGTIATAGGDLTQVYVARGMLVFSRDRKILAQALDERRGRLSGDPILIVDGVQSADTGRRAFAVSQDNLVYRPVFVESATLTWLASNGDVGPTLWEPGRFFSVELSPDGARAIVVRGDGSKSNLWAIDTARNVPQPLLDNSPTSVLWSRNGSRVLLARRRGLYHESIYSIAVDGPDVLVADKPDDNKWPVGWSETGSLLYGALNKSTRGDLWEQPESGPARIVIPAKGRNTDFSDAAVEPAGRFIAYAVDGTLYVQAVRNGTPVPVASGGAKHPRWRADGRQLYYLSGGHLMAVEVSGSDPVPFGPLRQLFEFKGSAFSPARDGRFLAAVPTSTEPSGVNVVFNWARLLTK
jgi:hypothetical protein